MSACGSPSSCAIVPKIIWLGRVRGLDAISDEADAVTFGATVTHQAAMPHLAAIDPDLGALMRRFAGRQVRTVGTHRRQYRQWLADR